MDLTDTITQAEEAINQCQNEINTLEKNNVPYAIISKKKEELDIDTKILQLLHNWDQDIKVYGRRLEKARQNL